MRGPSPTSTDVPILEEHIKAVQLEFAKVESADRLLQEESEYNESLDKASEADRIGREARKQAKDFKKRKFLDSGVLYDAAALNTFLAILQEKLHLAQEDAKADAAEKSGARLYSR